VLDGELVIFDPERERISLSLLSRRVTAGHAVTHEAQRHPALFTASDLLQLGGIELVERPLAERQARLERLLRGSPPSALCPTTKGRR
jgi:ATP-dependent DNA ligase